MTTTPEDNHIDIVFDGPPGHRSGRFVEVEDALGKSIAFGEWVQRSDGYWALRIEAACQLHEVAEERDEALFQCTLLGNDLDEAVDFAKHFLAATDPRDEESWAEWEALLDRIDRRKQSKVTT